MRFSLLALITCSLVVLTACEKPCPKGQQRYGAKCVMSPVYDAGLDGVDAGEEPELADGGAGESSMDGGEAVSCVPPKCHPCESAPCGMGGICSETDTGFECTCKVGFSGKKCEVDVCDLSPCVHGECVRTPVGRTCECDANYVGDTCDKNTDATLANLTVSAGTLFPAFKPNVLAYSVDLGISSPEVSVVATASAVDGAAIKVEGVAVQSGSASAPYALELNTSRVVHVDILADDGTKVEYEITLRRSLTQQAYVKRHESASGEEFGGRVTVGYGPTVAVDRTLAVVGIPVRAGGAVALIGRQGGVWAASRELDAGDHKVDGAGFGSALALTSDWLAVGAPFEGLNAGAAYVLKRSTLAGIPEIHRLVPSDPVVAERFGASVAAQGRLIVVSAPGAAVERAGVAQDSAGAVYVFEFDGAKWGAGQRLVSPNARTDDGFGSSIAIDAGRIIVGSPGDDLEVAHDIDSAGAVYVFERAGKQWDSSAVLRMAGSTRLGSSVGAARGRIATATARVCAFGGCWGQPDAYVFDLADGSWTAMSASSLPRAEDTPASLDAVQFGMSGLAFTGNLLVVPATFEAYSGLGVNPARDPSLPSAAGTGAAYVFAERTDGWHFDGYLKASNAAGGDAFGMSVAALDDTIIVSAPGEDSDADGISVDDSTAQSNNDASDSGAVYIFAPNCANVPSGAAVPGC